MVDLLEPYCNLGAPKETAMGTKFNQPVPAGPAQLADRVEKRKLLRDPYANANQNKPKYSSAGLN